MYIRIEIYFYLIYKILMLVAVILQMPILMKINKSTKILK